MLAVKCSRVFEITGNALNSPLEMAATSRSTDNLILATISVDPEQARATLLRLLLPFIEPATAFLLSQCRRPNPTFRGEV
jgi:hypothetical protein